MAAHAAPPANQLPLRASSLKGKLVLFPDSPSITDVTHSAMPATALLPDSSAQQLPILNISAYKFVGLDQIEQRRQLLLQVCQRLNLKGTILLSSEGINLFLAGAPASVAEFLNFLRADPLLADLESKDSYSAAQPFRRMLVRLKKEIIAFGVEGVAPEVHTSAKLPPRTLKEWLDAGEPVLLLDTRNTYEYELGSFDGAQHLHIDHFREFPQAISQLPEAAKQRPVVMFCTGGIRCEKAGPMMEQAGFEQVYQLEGGILKYFEECGGEHYHGSCFVFDGRVALDPQLKPTGNVLCFACQSVLTPAEVNSEHYLLGQYCPRCYPRQQQRIVEQLQQKEQAIRQRAAAQPGCTAYENLRKLYVPAKCAGLTALEFFTSWHPPTPREQWLAWLAAGQIRAAGRMGETGHLEGAEAIEPSRRVKEGECFEQRLPGTIEPPINPDIRLIHEDDWLVVVHKPAPLPVHPSGRYNQNTLLSLLAPFYPKQKLRAAHRLDAQTSGLIVLCRTQQAARRVQSQFAQGEVDKRYVARVKGHPTWDMHDCQVPLGDAPQSRGAREVDDSQGLPARTLLRVLQRLADGTAIVEAQPLTGRTHQIRLHLQHLGHAIVGDPLYDANETEQACESSELSRRQATMCLQASRISFKHPGNALRCTFEAAPPTWLTASHTGAA